MKVKRTERGWAGHFICGQECRFRRNTLIEYKRRKIVVSTVGNYFPAHKDEVGTIGWERYFETMAFYSDKKDKIYHDIDVGKQYDFESKWSINIKEFNDNKDCVDNIADKMHEDVVKEIMEKFKKETS